MPRSPQLPRRRADALAAELRLDVGSAPICLACLSIVAFALDRGNGHEIQGELVRVTRDLWDEGLAGHALDVVEEACHRRLRDAEAALADLERSGGSSPIARAIVLRLAGQLGHRMRTDMQLLDLARERLGQVRPELN